MQGLFARVKSVALCIKTRSFSYPRRKLRHAFLERTARRGQRRWRVTVASGHCRLAVPSCHALSRSSGWAVYWRHQGLKLPESTFLDKLIRLATFSASDEIAHTQLTKFGTCSVQILSGALVESFVPSCVEFESPPCGWSSMLLV